MRKKLSIVFALIFLFTSVLPAFAGEVRTFGFDDYRHRENNVSGTALFPVYYHNGGKSYSQPLILPGSKWGLDGKVVITVENNVLNGYLVPNNPPARFSEIAPAWSVQLDGDTPTTSHPTLIEKGGKKYIYIGTYSQYLDIVDITDFNSVGQSNMLSWQSPLVTDITSAPLILNWKGHEIVVCTTGDSGKVLIVSDALDEVKKNDFYINVGTGRTSSSPSPVANGAAFAVGLDGGFQQHGELQIYYLDDILQEDQDGKVALKSQNYRVRKSLPSGLVASFAVDGDMLWFGDSNSNVYVYNVATGELGFNSDNAGTFSNRSPALTASRVYFPVTNYGSPDAQGKLVAIDRSDGSTAFALPMEYNGENMGRTMTAPVVMRAGSQAQIVAGTGLGDLAFIDPIGGSMVGAYNISKVTGDANYASGVTGEISVWDNLGVTTSEQGVIIWQLLPAGNLKAVSLDLGVPAGQKAIPGTEYTAKVIFENQSNYTYPSVPVAVMHGQYAATLYDENGQVLPTKTINSKQVQVADFGPNAKRTFTSKWHPQAQAKDGLTGYINRPEVAQVYQEATYADNVISADVPVDFQNLRVEITGYPADVIEGDTATVEARVFNDAGQMVVTKVVWKVDGNVVKEVDNFDVISQADTTVSFTMPPNGVNVEVIVNPAQDVPPNESTYEDNRASCNVKFLPKRLESSGNMSISAPNRIRSKPFGAPGEKWDFTVSVTTYIPKPPPPPPDSDFDPPPPIISVKVYGESKAAYGGFRHENGLYGTVINQDVRPVSPTWSESYIAEYGEYTWSGTFTFPWSGLYDNDITANISAAADSEYYDIHLSASNDVIISGMEAPDFEVKLTQ